MTDIREALRAYSEWLGHGHGERAEAWWRRLEVNRPELEAFRAAPATDLAMYAPQPAFLVPPEGVEAPAPAFPGDAHAAWRRAREASHLRAFTFVPSALEPAAEGLLGGVPVVVKDLMPVAGMPLTGGSRALDARPAARDAEVVARLRRAGAVVVGLANLHEFAYGITSDNPHFGRVVNPAAPGRIPGGSSGGSAAAVAAGVTRLAVGTDTAGSIRIPAACCGIVGFKPSYDALPRDGVLDLGPTLDHVGPMARSVEEAAVAFAAMLGETRVPAWRPRDLSGWRIARLRGYFEHPLDADVRGAVEAAARALSADGAALRDAEVDGIEMAAAIQFNTLCAEAGAVHADRVRSRGGDFGEDVRVRVEIANFLPGHWYVKAQRLRTGLVREIERSFGDADLLLCASLRCPAPPVGAAEVAIGERTYALHTAVTQLTMPFNLSGLPAISIPWDRSSDGVPVCLQLVGRRGCDWAVLGAAARLQAAAPWRPPA